MEYLTRSGRMFLSHRNQFNDMQNKSMNWFLFYGDLRHERVKECRIKVTSQMTKGNV